MKRFLIPRPSRCIGFVVIVLAVLVGTLQSAMASGADGSDPGADASQREQIVERDDRSAAVKLRCDGEVHETRPAVDCSWRSGRDVAVRAWQVWKLQVWPRVGERSLVAEVGPDVTSVRDQDVDVPAGYVYVVLGLDNDGDIIARSRSVGVRLADHRLEILDLDCEGVVSPEGSAVGCAWSAVQSERAVNYEIYRAADDQPRQKIDTVGLGSTTYRDTRTEPGVRYQYSVVAVDADGELVAIARPVVAGLPDEPRGRDRAVRPAPRPDAERVTDAVNAEPAAGAQGRSRDR